MIEFIIVLVCVGQFIPIFAGVFIFIAISVHLIVWIAELGLKIQYNRK